MKASYSLEFLEAITCGETPKRESIVEVFPKRSSTGLRIGYNLFQAEERKLAFEALYKLREFIVNL